MKSSARLILFLLMLSGPGCATRGAVNDYCLVAAPIYGTAEDADKVSDQLLAGLYAHNCTYKTICKADINLDCE